jgi:hypothetical protein
VQRKEEASQAPKDAMNHVDGASVNQVTNAMILNIANIRIKNNTTIMVSDLLNRQAIWSDQEQDKHQGHKKSQEGVPCPATERWDPSLV